MAFEWTPNMSVGDETIDNQHKKLLKQVNKLIDALNVRSELSAVRETVSFLGKYVEEHLRYEEKYQEEHNYPGLEEHKKIHAGFEKFYEEYSKEFKGIKQLSSDTARQLAEKAREFLGEWLMNHIAGDDHKFYEYIKKQSGS